jgi:hypothetical protein
MTSDTLRTLVFVLLVCSRVVASPGTINPGEIWPDDRGAHIQAHGGGVIRLDGTWYWFGEDRAKDLPEGTRAVACYSSIDLVHWIYRNRVLSLTGADVGVDGLILERPKAYYNTKTGKFVLYMHIDNGRGANGQGAYQIARVGVAVCDRIDGDYRFLRSFRPLGKESRDIGQFIDDDGTAYLIFESRPTKGFFIARLSDDYLEVEKQTAFIEAPLEGGALVKYENLYYLIASQMKGWTANPNKYATARKIEGPWSDFKDVAPPETNTYESQSTNLIKVVGTHKTSVIYLGDRWKPATQWDSRYIWMPLEIGEGRLRLPEPAPWQIDVRTGVTTIVSRPSPPALRVGGPPLATGRFPAGGEAKEIKFTAPVRARYFMLEAVDSENPDPMTSIAELSLLGPDGQKISPKRWKVAGVDSEEYQGESAEAAHAIDGQANTFWHTKWKWARPVHPHWITLDLGGTETLSGFVYLPRSGSPVGRIKDYRAYAGDQLATP